MAPLPSEVPVIESGLKRSGKWPAVRRKHLKKQPCCQICGAVFLLNVHHIQPFHLFPDLELDPANLVTLCEGNTVNCHYFIGHLMDWKTFNPDVLADAMRFQKIVKQRKRQG